MTEASTSVGSSERSQSDQAAITRFLKHIASSKIPFDEKRLRRAFAIAQEIYGDQMHWMGIPYLEHTINVLEVLLPFQPDEDAVIACILHHVLETGNCSLSDLEEHFGPKVRSLVSAVHLLSHVTLRGRRMSIEDLRLMFLTVSDDVRTVLIVLCDRLHLLDNVHEIAPKDRKRLCQDSLQLFAPVAARLGIYRLKHDLEGRAFPIVYPSDAERIKEQLDRLYAERGDFLNDTAEALRAYLAEQGIDAVVESREKQLFSIFVKMRMKSISHIENLYDLFALRVIVRNEEECYSALGLLHRLGRPIANRFKDYIAFPKPNGYQSLHTTLIDLPCAPADAFVEVQVRTQDMHREAEYGVAAHWSFKEQGSATHAIQTAQLRNMLASQQSVEEEEESPATLADHIFVLTPRGDVIELPEGATPLDFAFQVHTDLGLSFRGARVNGSIAALDYQLENGDVVEIQKFRNPKPSPQWLQLLKMASSRSKLKRYLYAQQRPEFIARGREILNGELRKHRLSPLDTDLSLLRMYEGEQFTMHQREDLLMKIGQGSEKSSSVLFHLDALKGKDIALPQQPRRERLQRKDAVIEIEGGLRMPLRYAQCCKPHEEKKGPISGVINRLGEVMVHRETCGMLRNANPGRCVNVWWR